MIQQKNFSSTQVKNIQYDSDTKVMRITFNNGAQYDYQNVPVSVWDGAQSASSIGQYVNANIKSTYKYSKV